MKWAEKITCHATAGYPNLDGLKLEEWKPAGRHSHLSDPEHVHITVTETCRFCGGANPRDLITLAERYPKLKMSLADMKWGYPHKVYVNLGELLFPDEEFPAMTRYVDGRREVMTTTKGHAPLIKFYTVHLFDEGLDEEACAAVSALLLKYVGLELTVNLTEGSIFSHFPNGRP
jgi:hypothetical protein